MRSLSLRYSADFRRSRLVHSHHHHHPFTPYKGLGCLLWGQLLFRCRAMFFAVIQAPHPSGHDLRSSFPVNLLISIPSIWFVFLISGCCWFRFGQFSQLCLAMFVGSTFLPQSGHVPLAVPPHAFIWFVRFVYSLNSVLHFGQLCLFVILLCSFRSCCTRPVFVLHFFPHPSQRHVRSFVILV